MIPCPVCLKVLDGAGGTCAHHMEWTIGRIWLAGVWPSLEELTESPDPAKVAQLYAANRGHFSLTAEAAIRQFIKAQLPGYERGVFLGFRHWRQFQPRFARDGYAQFAAGIVLPVLARHDLVRHDQVEGICHLFYDGLEDSPTRGAGVELLICEGPAR